MYHFSNQHADRVVRFFRTQLRYVEGAAAGKPFVPEPWQEKLLRDIFGWLRPDGTRRYRTAYIEVPRKNGKSTWGAGVALYLLLADGENRPQVYSAAGDRAQARVVFQAAREMVEANSKMQTVAELRQYEIRNLKSGGWYEALASDGARVHGRSPSGIIFDEVHVQKDRVLWDGLQTGVAARAQPLTIAITTAGWDRSSICWELHQRALAVLDNPDNDPTFYAALWGADSADDWTSEDTWRKANPNLGVSVSIDYLREQCAAAKDNPAAENTFRNLHLNQWTEQAVRWIQMHTWDECREEYDEGSFFWRKCYAAIDLASTRDVNALILLFPEDDGRYSLLPYYWVPEDAHDKRGVQDRRMVTNWAERGLIKRTPGNVTDYDVLANDLCEILERFDVQAIAYDPWGPALPLVQMLQSRGARVDSFREFRQTIGNFAAPTKEFGRLVASRRLRHNGCPVLRWMASNVTVKTDSNENLRPDKEKSQDKIDGIVAAIMALGLAITEPEQYTYQPGSLAL